MNEPPFKYTQKIIQIGKTKATITGAVTKGSMNTVK
jgi:hypothetical protein